jgi:hypothetical protein
VDVEKPLDIIHEVVEHHTIQTRYQILFKGDYLEHAEDGE